MQEKTQIIRFCSHAERNKNQLEPHHFCLAFKHKCNSHVSRQPLLPPKNAIRRGIMTVLHQSILLIFLSRKSNETKLHQDPFLTLNVTQGRRKVHGLVVFSPWKHDARPTFRKNACAPESTRLDYVGVEKSSDARGFGLAWRIGCIAGETPFWRKRWAANGRREKRQKERKKALASRILTFYPFPPLSSISTFAVTLRQLEFKLFSLYVKARVLSHKRGKRNTRPNTTLVQVEGVDSKESARFYLGKVSSSVFEIGFLASMESVDGDTFGRRGM